MKGEDIKTVVKEAYAGIAKQGRSGCTPATSCCESVDGTQEKSRKVGYSEEVLYRAPGGED